MLRVGLFGSSWTAGMFSVNVLMFLQHTHVEHEFTVYREDGKINIISG